MQKVLCGILLLTLTMAIGCSRSNTGSPSSETESVEITKEQATTIRTDRSPREVVETFFAHLKRGATSEASKLVSDPKDPHLAGVLSEGMNDIDHVLILREEVEEAKAKVIITMIGKDGSKHEDDVDLIRKNDKWLIHSV